MQVNLAELQKIPFLRADVLGNRGLMVPSHWEGTRWSCWVPQAEGTLFEMHPLDCSEGSYVAREAAAPDDIHVPFADFMWRRIGWSDVQHWQRALVEDVHQMAASLDKISFFWACRGSVDASLSPRLRRFVETEIEYLLTLNRSAFDLLQEVMRAVWRHIKLVDPDAQRKKGDLKKSFADMVMHADRKLSAVEIAETRRVPLPLAEAYATAAEQLDGLRRLRDEIVHQGKNAPVVFVTERGFAIAQDDPVLRTLPIWTDAHRFNERLVSLRPALAWIVMAAIDACNGFAETLSRIFQLPPDIAPDPHVFIRTVHGNALLRTCRDDLLLPLYRAIEQHAIQRATNFRIDDTGSVVITIKRQIEAELASFRCPGRVDGVSHEHFVARHHALDIGLHVPFRFMHPKEYGVGGELGYRFYTGSRGPNGFFVGPSVLAGRYSETLLTYTPLFAGSSDYVRIREQAWFWAVGGALDIGGSFLIRDRVRIAGGIGVQYLAAFEDPGKARNTIVSIAFDGLRPRLLLSAGWAF